MKSIVTGADGFIGYYLIKNLAKNGDEVIGTFFESTPNLKEIQDNNIQTEYVNFRSRRMIDALLRKHGDVDRIFHLAAQSLPMKSMKDPIGTFETNIIGTTHLFEEIRKRKLNPVVLVACSSAEYGEILNSRPRIEETTEHLPEHVYGISKVAQDLIARCYHQHHGIKTIRAKIFNTIGPRKTGDVVADFAEQVARIEAKKQEPIINVGNLNTKRDFTDVRDTVRALELLTEQGKYGEDYHICSSNVHSVQEILDYFLHASSIKLQVKVADSLARKIDEPEISGSYKKLNLATGWKPAIAFNKTLEDSLNYWRTVHSVK